jgi:uncharacterized protein
MTAANSSAASASALPWWRVGMVWLVLGGPVTVVLACIVTVTLAVKTAEPVLIAQPSAKFSDKPAVQGRNHAATATTPP